MTPRLFRNDATSFDRLGFGILSHTISCTIKEDLKSAPTLEMSLLMDDPLFVEVKVDNIIVAEPNKNDVAQAFVIEEITKPIDGVVTIYATHIAQHRGKLIPVAPFSASNLDEALSLMVSSSTEDNPFTLVRDPNKNNVVASMHPTVPHSFRELMGGVSGSILDTYRGEWKYDNFTCTLYNKRGRDNGVRVMYGRNMSDFKLEEQFNWDNSATGVIGYWVNSDDGTTVIGDIQYSDYADLYPYKKTVCVDFSDKWESAPSVTDLNTYALSWINGKGLYGSTVEVAFEHLNVEGGADIGLGDVVHIFNGTYNFEMESRIVGLEYDVLAEEYTSVTIGEQRTTLNEAIADIGGGTTSSGGGGGASVDPSTTLPLMDGTASVGTEQTYARGDHVHPSDTAKVSKTGDTMTGILYVERDGASVVSDQTAIDLSTTPSSDIWKNVILIRDKNDQTLGNLMTFHGTNGRSGVHFEAERIVNGVRKTHPIRVELDANGNPYVTGIQAPWLTFLGLQPTEITLTLGSYGQQFGSYMRAHRYGRLVVININIYLKAITSAGQIIFSGLPAPFGSGAGFSLSADGASRRFYIHPNGSARSDNNNSPAGWYDGSVVYIANS